MLDVHPPHAATHTWRDFFIHIATIVVGLLIAVGLEQTVEFFHHRHQASEARVNIQKEVTANITALHYNLQKLDESTRDFQTSLDALNSKAPDAEVLAHLKYEWELTREADTAWVGAKVDGSLALIPPVELRRANYLYTSNSEATSTLFAYFIDVDTAAAIVDHARMTGKLTDLDRQQLIARTTSALGYTRLLSRFYGIHLEIAEKINLE